LQQVARTRPGPDGAGLVRLCRGIAEELNLPQVVLQVTGDGMSRRSPSEFRWPDGRDFDPSPRRGFRDHPVLLSGEVVGNLRLPTGALRRLGSDQSRTLTDVVALLGPLLHLARLELQRDGALIRAGDYAERIGAARRAAFAERDQERRELERDLHDGAQHHLVALRMAVALLEMQLGTGDAATATLGLNRLRSGIAQAEQTLLSTAAGNCPPVLVEHGLGPALTAEFGGRSGSLPEMIGLTVPPTGQRVPLLVEIAVYFTCLEAVNNALKHAPGAQVEVLVREGPEGLSFSVTDDGPGVEGAESVKSFGLGNMRSRIESVGGQLDLWTQPGVGTTIDGLIPLRGSGR